MAVVLFRCKSCGSTDFEDLNGIYRCNYCGAIHTLEEKRVRVEGHVDITGSTVRMDSRDILKNYYKIARRAKKNTNKEIALTYYNKIIEIDPESWEANFYISYYQALRCSRISDITLAAKRIIIDQKTIIDFIRKEVLAADERKKAIDEAAKHWIYLSDRFFKVYQKYYDSLDAEQKEQIKQSYADTCSSVRDIAYLAGDWIVIYFGDEYGTIAADCWKAGITIHTQMNNVLINDERDNQTLLERKKEIVKFDPEYEQIEDNKESKNQGCYIATSVYGSYDCPQVWTLRRFRDYTLAKIWYGRLFISVYYAVSPYLVKWFGHTRWFKNIWRKSLDQTVALLNSKGVSDAPYEDRKG